MSVATAVNAGGSFEGSPLLHWSFVLVTLLDVVLLSGAVYWSALRSGVSRAAAIRHGTLAAGLSFGWLALTGVAAGRGLLQFEPPPTMLVLIALVLVLAIGLALSPVGGRIARSLPLAALVGYQSFRILVELLLHRAYTEGLMPVQMSYAGRNFDVVTGITALALGLWLATGRTSARLVLAWNTLGVALLANILGVALLSAPTPFRVFMNEPANVWVTQAPWVWLPAAMVFMAVFGHVLVYRRLWQELRVMVRLAARRSAPAFGLLALLAITSCVDVVEVVPPWKFERGSLVGTVTLLGSDGPSDPAGLRISLYASESDIEEQRPQYEAQLLRVPGAVRSYEYTFSLIVPGDYYTIACFSFGCGGYRNPASGELVRVHVSSAHVTQLHFGI